MRGSDGKFDRKVVDEAAEHIPGKKRGTREIEREETPKTYYEGGKRARQSQIAFRLTGK